MTKNALTVSTYRSYNRTFAIKHQTHGVTLPPDARFHSHILKVRVPTAIGRIPQMMKPAQTIMITYYDKSVTL